MLKSSGSEGRGVGAKVADFGLSIKLEATETHLSNAFQVRGVGEGVAGCQGCICSFS
jgi:hypothetical protein